MPSLRGLRHLSILEWLYVLSATHFGGFFIVEKEVVMGKSGEALTCQERGFLVGDVIEGEEDGRIARLKIKFIGNDVVVFDELMQINGVWQFYEETAQWTLNARDWRVVEHCDVANNALAYMTDCQKEWSERAIKYKAQIERTNEIALKQAKYHQEFADKYADKDDDRKQRHLERVQAWLSIVSFWHD
jgi:hypothetical protein